MLPEPDVAAVRRRRRHPSMWQFDGLHLRRLVQDLEQVLGHIDHRVSDVLDLYCGARPYDDLLPQDARKVGFDVVDNFGVADVVSEDFLPFPDSAFDVVLCIEAFHYVADPVAGVAELRRVLRPGGTALVAVPLVWEYDRTVLEHRYTGPELMALFEDWEEVQLFENGGRGVAWACLTGRLLRSIERRIPAGRFLRPVFACAYFVVNTLGVLVEIADRRVRSQFTLPMNLLVAARTPQL
jgi:SAM-dependent methyltransferase